jgi:hypothetical protein
LDDGIYKALRLLEDYFNRRFLEEIEPIAYFRVTKIFNVKSENNTFQVSGGFVEKGELSIGDYIVNEGEILKIASMANEGRPCRQAPEDMGVGITLNPTAILNRNTVYKVISDNTYNIFIKKLKESLFLK